MKENWTERLIQELHRLLPDGEFSMEGDIVSLNCPADVFEQVVKFIPKEALDFRHNNAPSIRQIIARLKDCIAVDLYIISSSREEDNFIGVDAVYVKADKLKKCLNWWLDDADFPDQVDYIPTLDAFLIWWD